MRCGGSSEKAIASTARTALRLDIAAWAKRPPVIESACFEHGAAGIAFALQRLGDVGAATATDRIEALLNRDSNHENAVSDAGSAYRGTAGAWAVLAESAPDVRRVRALDALTRCVAIVDGEPIEYMHGAAGRLAAVARALAASDCGAPEQLVEAAAETARTMAERLREALARHGDRLPLGVAHGSAGVIWAGLRFALATSTTPLPHYLDALETIERRTLGDWREALVSGATDIAAYDLAASWCNGVAGLVLVWETAYRCTGEARFLRRAVEAGEFVADAFRDSGPSLCCGLAGMGFALATLARATGEPRWRSRAEQFAERAAVLGRADLAAAPCGNLLKGALGVALLAAELEAPDAARLPFL